MSVFDEIKNLLFGEFSDWIQIRDYKSSWTIEDFPYETGVDEKLTSPHCWKCVTVNQCWFKNEKDKKPEEYDYTKYSIVDIPLLKRGLYHPKCHCKKKELIDINADKISFIALEGKINHFFKDKLNWFYSWGYKDNDRDEFVDKILNLTKQAFIEGRYESIVHNQYGYKINVFINLPGKNEKQNHIYDVKTCWMIFPNGKLKCNTLIGGRA